MTCCREKLSWYRWTCHLQLCSDALIIFSPILLPNKFSSVSCRETTRLCSSTQTLSEMSLLWSVVIWWGLVLIFVMVWLSFFPAMLTCSVPQFCLCCLPALIRSTCASTSCPLISTYSPALVCLSSFWSYSKCFLSFKSLCFPLSSVFSSDCGYVSLDFAFLPLPFQFVFPVRLFWFWPSLASLHVHLLFCILLHRWTGFSIKSLIEVSWEHKGWIDPLRHDHISLFDVWLNT